MTVRAIRALALAGTMALLAACTSSTTASTPSPLPSSPPTPVPSPPTSPSPTPATTARWEVVTGVDAVSPSFVVASMGVCKGPRYDARCSQHLMATQDAGATWYDLMAPSIEHGSALEHPFFLDPTTGWVVDSNCSGGPAWLDRTSDGGRTWGSTKVGYQTCNAGAAIEPGFVDPLHGWLLHLEPTGPIAQLSRTTDGGKTWHRVGSRMVGAPEHVVFTSTTVGWMSTNRNGEGVLQRSTDGGTTWSAITLPRPPSAGKAAAFADVPTLLADGTLVAPVTYRDRSHVVVAFERSTDGGRTWSVERTWSGAAPHPDAMWPGVDTSVVGPKTFWIAPGGTSVYRSEADGWAAVPIGSAPLSGIAAASSRLAWGLRPVRRANVLVRIGPHGTKEMTPWPASAAPTANGMTPIATLSSWPAAVAGSVDGVYVALSDGHTTTVERIDPRTGRVAATVTVPHGSSCGCHDISLAESGGDLWLLIGTRHAHLVRLDPLTLRVGREEPITHAAKGLAATASGVWVGTGDRAALYTATQAQPVRAVALPGPPLWVAASPDGADLYVALNGPVRHDADPLREVDAATGATVASTYAGVHELNGVSALAPTGDGVWIGVPTGMMGSVALLRAGTLAQVAGPIDGSNGIAPGYAAGRLWITDAQRLTCNDAESGRTLGSPGVPGQDYGTVVQAGSVVVGALGKTLYRIDPSVAC